MIDKYKNFYQPETEDYEKHDISVYPEPKYNVGYGNKPGLMSNLVHVVLNNGMFQNGLICYMLKLKNHQPFWVEWSTNKPLAKILCVDFNMPRYLIKSWKYIKDAEELERINNYIEEDAFVKGYTDKL